MIITRTPYRLSLLGGGSDHPDWFLENGGAVLAGAIDKYCYLTLRWLPPFFEHRYRIVYGKTEIVKELSLINHPVVRSVFTRYEHLEGLELHHDGDLPARSGIGSSSAFTVGLLHAMRALLELDTDRWSLALEAIDVERNDLAEIVGCQDQVTCALGGFHHLRFQTSGDIELQRSQKLGQNVAALNEWLVLVYSGVSRSSHEVSKDLVPSLASKPSLMRELVASVEEGHSLLGQGTREAFLQFGKLLDMNFRIKQELNPRAVSTEIKELYTLAQSAGAIGGKISGAGGGGFLLFMVEPERRNDLLNLMRTRGLVVPFRFVEHGSEILFTNKADKTNHQWMQV